jgi:hypothetical protein
MIKTRLISLVLIASLFAYSLACLGIVKGFGMCDGGGLL